MIAVLLWGCAGPTTEPPPGGTATEDTAPPARPMSSSCDLQDGNALRIACLVDLPEPGSVTLTLAPAHGGGLARSFVSPGPATDHEVVGFDLRGMTAYTWEIVGSGGELRTGMVTTGTAPMGLRVPMEVAVNGDSSIERLLMPWSCNGSALLLVVDGDGLIRWYQDIPVGVINNVAASDSGTFLVLLSRGIVAEYAMDGTLVRQSEHEDNPSPLHHDLLAKHGRRAALHASLEQYPNGSAYIVDGITSLVDAPAEVWSYGDVVDPQGLIGSTVGYWMGTYVNAIDFGHANALDVDEQGVWLVSFKHQDTVMAIVGDPAAPDVGTVAWSIAGGALAGEPGTLALTSTAGIEAAFEHPHNARWLADGGITLVDNGRFENADDTRVLRIDIDVEAGTADVVREYVLTGHRCPVQSSAYPLADGSVVVMCTATGTLFEFEPDGTLRREVGLSCPDDPAGGGLPGLGASIISAIPVTLSAAR